MLLLYKDKGTQVPIDNQQDYQNHTHTVDNKIGHMEIHH